MELLLGTDDGLVAGYWFDGRWMETTRRLKGRRITSLAAGDGYIYAGTIRGIFRSEDGGVEWQEASAGLSIKYVRWLIFHPVGLGPVGSLVVAGTEPAMIFMSTNNGQSWSERLEIGRLRNANGWFLPYSPEDGCVRGFAGHGDRLYAAAEVGGLLRSDNRGLNWSMAPGSSGRITWSPPPGFIHPDVHSVEVHPSSPDLVYAPTGGGFYISTDGGRSWQLAHEPCYCRAVWIDGLDPGHIVLGPADSVDQNGRIVRTTDGGQTWQALADGVETPWHSTMVERFRQVKDELFAVLSDGRLLAAVIGIWQWRDVIGPDPRQGGAKVNYLIPVKA